MGDRDAESMRHLLNWITHEPDLLAEAPQVPSLAVAAERAREQHLCLHCGDPAQGFFWIRPSDWSDVARWMDLCSRCCHLVHEVSQS